MIAEHLFALVFLLPCAADADVVEVQPPPPGKFAEFKADAGRQLVLRAAKATEWAVVDESAAQLTVIGEQAVFTAPAAGRYRLACVADGKLLRIAVTVAGGPPPGPNPQPADQLRQKLAAAFAADKGTKADAQQLTVLYRQLVDLARNEEVTSTADLLRRAKASASGMVGPAVLKTLRGVVAEELQAAIGKATEEPITEAERERAAALFAKLAEILPGL